MIVAEPVKPVAVRARDAASLILLRGQGRDLELLVGRRPMTVRFMPGVYVFPGGAVDAEDARPWQTETGAEWLPPRLRRCARAALRETWEELGVFFGHPGAPREALLSGSPVRKPMPRPGWWRRSTGSPISAARLPRRGCFAASTRGFSSATAPWLSASRCATDELEDVRWHPIGRDPLEPFRDVSQFMLARAIAVYEGNDSSPAPLFYTVAGKRRIGVCREAVAGALSDRAGIEGGRDAG